MLGVLGIIISLGLLMYLAYRGISVLILAPVLAMLAALFSAAPMLGLAGAAIMFGGGLFWINRRAKAAMDKGEGYGEHEDKTSPTAEEAPVPHVMAAFSPIVVMVTAWPPGDSILQRGAERFARQVHA